MTDFQTNFLRSVVGGKIYIISGKRNTCLLDEVEVFDAKANTIRHCEGDSSQSRQPFSILKRFFFNLAMPYADGALTSASIGNLIFVAGGFNQNTTLLIFDTVHGTWAMVSGLGVLRIEGNKYLNLF